MNMRIKVNQPRIVRDNNLIPIPQTWMVEVDDCTNLRVIIHILCFSWAVDFIWSRAKSKKEPKRWFWLARKCKNISIVFNRPHVMYEAGSSWPLPSCELIVRPKVMRCKDGHRHLTSLEIKFNLWWIRRLWNPITFYYKGKWYDEEGLPF